MKICIYACNTKIYDKSFSRESGFLSKNAKVNLTIANTIECIKSKGKTSLPIKSVFYLVYQISENISVSKKHKEPIQDTLVEYS